MSKTACAFIICCLFFAGPSMAVVDHTNRSFVLCVGCDESAMVHQAIKQGLGHHYIGNPESGDILLFEVADIVTDKGRGFVATRLDPEAYVVAEFDKVIESWESDDRSLESHIFMDMPKIPDDAEAIE